MTQLRGERGRRRRLRPEKREERPRGEGGEGGIRETRVVVVPGEAGETESLDGKELAVCVAGGAGGGCEARTRDR